MYRVAYKRCGDILLGRPGGTAESALEVFRTVDIKSERVQIGIAADDVLDQDVADYLQAETAA